MVLLPSMNEAESAEVMNNRASAGTSNAMPNVGNGRVWSTLTVATDVASVAISATCVTPVVSRCSAVPPSTENHTTLTALGTRTTPR